jgi:SAM-dependent methyltransferase
VVTPQLKKLVLARRVMLTTEMDLDTLFGDPRPWTAGQKLNPTGPVGDFTVSYTYKGVAVNVSSTVREIGSRRFLASNILVPANLEDGTIPETSKNFNDALAPFRGKRGLEMGGPTGIFGGIFNIYAAAASVDNMNYASKTLWGGIAERYVVGGRDIGAAYVVDAAHVGERFKDTPYDFVASSNVLEHLANPLSVMKQLVSILKPDGMLVIVVPYKHACFDRLRDYTPFSDLVHHYLKDDKESENLDHMEEWLQLIDMNALDGDRVFVGTLAQLRSRTIQNDARRAIHHHVYHQTTVSHMCAWAGMGTVFQERSGLEMFTICQRRARLPSDVPGFGAGFEPTYY